MNLREAIEAGAERVAHRVEGVYIGRRYLPDGSMTHVACALGAAYLACHPDVDPEAAIGTVSGWADELYERLPRVKSDEWQKRATCVVIATNDETPGDDFNSVIDALEPLRTVDDTPLLDMEVC